MTYIATLIIPLMFIMLFMLPLCIMAWFVEETKLGAYIMEKVMHKFNLD